MGDFKSKKWQFFTQLFKRRYFIIVKLYLYISFESMTCNVCTVKVDSSVFVLSRTGHFEYSPVHNSVNINGRNFILHLHGSYHMCVSMCDQHFL